MVASQCFTVGKSEVATGPDSGVEGFSRVDSTLSFLGLQTQFLYFYK
jgi:hypothetical protein